MKIAYVLYPNAILSGDSNGIKKQAKIWNIGLTKLGHEVIEVNPWGNYKWIDFDLIHVFGTGLWLNSFIKGLYVKNKNIVFSPIIDTIQTPFKYKLSTYIGFKKFRLWSPTYALKNTLPFLKGVFVRSDYESIYLKKSLSFKDEKIYKIMLPYDMNINDIEKLKKENFCLHISSIYQERKNVIRLIQAAKKYNFNLVLAGAKGTEEQFRKIKKVIGNSKNIKVLGFISETEMIDLYKRAKVFALPSISEGVGLVALNAAVFGCDIVITNLGGPKEYYNNFANLVDPLNVDDIGRSIMCFLNDITHQPQLKNYVTANFREDIISKKIEKAYQNILQF